MALNAAVALASLAELPPFSLLAQRVSLAAAPLLTLWAGVLLFEDYRRGRRETLILEIRAFEESAIGADKWFAVRIRVSSGKNQFEPLKPGWRLSLLRTVEEALKVENKMETNEQDLYGNDPIVIARQLLGVKSSLAPFEEKWGYRADILEIVERTNKDPLRTQG
jgi:hypothetical protein